MENTARKIDSQLQAKVIGHINLSPSTGMDAGRVPAGSGDEVHDAFLLGQSSQTWSFTQIKNECARVIAEISELQAENRWADIVALFFPVEQQLPELVDAGLDAEIRGKVSFALCRDGRHEQAILCLQPVIEKEPGNSLAHYSLGYTVVDLFFQARTQRKIIPPQRKTELIKLAHHHFAIAIQLRPDSVTYCYRQAIFFKEIETKPKQAIPLFRQAIANWQKLSAEDQQKYHQQRPKYIKSLYHLASCLLTTGQAKESLSLLQTMFEEDRTRNHMHPLFKHFAMGKVLHALSRFSESLQHLETAGQVADRGQATDFVWELAGRNALCLGNPDKAMACINKIEPQRRRPYVRWTEANILVARGNTAEALQLLHRCAENDRRGKHVAYMQICRIALSKNDLQPALDAVRKAVRFCIDTYGNPSKEARFWEAVCLYRLGRSKEALPIIEELEGQRFQYANFCRLAQLVRNPQAAAQQVGTAAGTAASSRPVSSLKQVK